MKKVLDGDSVLLQFWNIHPHLDSLDFLPRVVRVFSDNVLLIPAPPVTASGEGLFESELVPVSVGGASEDDRGRWVNVEEDRIVVRQGAGTPGTEDA